MVISGNFVKKIFSSNNGYTVAIFCLKEEKEEITVVGYLPPMDKETTYDLYGEFVEHYKYGLQFSIESFEKSPISDEEALVKYLSGPQFKGVGPKLAQNMVDTLGNDLIASVKENPNLLDDVKGMTAKKKEAILTGLNNDEDEKYFYLTSHHLSMKNVMKIEKVYGDRMLEVLNSNPYQAISDVDGVGFATIDPFALAIGFPEDHPYRLQALAESLLLEWCSNAGDSYIEYDEYVSKLTKELPIECDKEQIINNLFEQNRIVIEEERVYHITQYTAERYIASYLANFPLEHIIFKDTRQIVEGIGIIEEQLGIKYQDKQKEAIESFFTDDFLIITGGPGTGKTTLVRGIVSLCQLLYPQYKITLCASTGRASKRLAELTGCEARTLHSLLRWDKETGSFSMNEDNPLLIDLLIIDEFSMVDQWLFYSLLKAGKNIRKIILIGDPDQLPSVGIGSVLRDLLATDLFKVVRLEKIYRQQEGSTITSLAYDIKRDECYDVVNENDVRFIECEPSQVKDVLLQVVDYGLASFSNREEGLMNVQVLAPQYKGANGIDNLNVVLQKKYNPASSDKKELNVGYRIFRVGDKILQLKNQPDDDVYNGDIGILEDIILAKEDYDHQNRIFVNFDGILVEYTSETFVNITLAYCVSVHKAQGSEYPIVIMPIVREYTYMLQKRLLYTAVSRANSSLILIGQKQVFLKGVQKNEYYERKTTLQARIEQQLG